MTDIEKLKQEVKEAIEACNAAISKLCTIEHSLKGLHFKQLLDNQPKTEFKPDVKPKGDPLAELQHNIKNMQGDQLKNLIQKLQQESSQPETPPEVTENKGT